MIGHRLTVDATVILAEVIALAACCPEALSPFEAELLDELRGRLADFGQDATATAEEWRVVLDVRPALQRRAREAA